MQYSFSTPQNLNHSSKSKQKKVEPSKKESNAKNRNNASTSRSTQNQPNTALPHNKNKIPITSTSSQHKEITNNSTRRPTQSKHHIHTTTNLGTRGTMQFRGTIGIVQRERLCKVEEQLRHWDEQEISC